jgi:hypothetical protein
MIRRASILKALLGVCALGLPATLPGAASARPVVKIKAAAIPIPVNLRNPHSPTYPGTGAILGAPVAMEAQLTIAGSEYGGSPSPLTQIKFYAPAGAKVSAQGFATCAETMLKENGAEGCPARFLAGPLGEAGGVVSFGSTRVHEKVSLQAFFGPGGEIFVYVVGETPASIELISKGMLANASPPFGKVFTGEVPLVESVPGALDASVEQIKIRIGAAFKRAGKLVSYLTAPRTCPKGGFPIKVELSFLSGETVPAEARIPCPARKR